MADITVTVTTLGKDIVRTFPNTTQGAEDAGYWAEGENVAPAREIVIDMPGEGRFWLRRNGQHDDKFLPYPQV